MRNEKNKFQKYFLHKVIGIVVIWLFVALLIQMILTPLLKWGENYCGFHNSMLDLFAVITPMAGVLLVSTYDIFRMLVIIISAIPFMIWIEKSLHRTIIEPVSDITQTMSQTNEDHLNATVKESAKYELQQMQKTFNDMTQRLQNAEIMRQNLENQKQLLIAGMAHDLKTPITTILGYSQALRDHIVTDEKKKEEYIEAINRKAVNLNDLINLMFDYIRLQSNEFILERKETDLVELLREAVGIYYTDFEEHNLEVVMDLPSTSISAMIDPIQYIRVFQNLLSNELKYAGEHHRIYVGMQYDKNLKIMIGDDGDDIAPELEQKLFDPFVMGDTARQSGKGNGLGLCIAQKIVNLHGGSISIEHNLIIQNVNYTKLFVIRPNADELKCKKIT